MSTKSFRLAGIVAALVLTFASWAISQTPPNPSPPHPGPQPSPHPRRLPRKALDDDAAKWEHWWATNREDFLIPRAVMAPDVAGDQYSASLAPPIEQEIRAAVIPALLEALRDNDHQVRAAAALSLGRCGDWREIRVLAGTINDRERLVAEAAILGIGLLGEGSAEGPLRDALNETTRNSRERAFAAIALGYSGGDLARTVLFDQLGTTNDAEGRSRVPSIESCRMLGAALWAGADKRDGNADRSPLAASQIQKALSNPNLRDRMILGVGTAALSKTRDPGSLLFVLRGLADQRSDVRAGCAIAAGRIVKAEDRQSVQTIINALGSEAELLPRRMMLISLGRIGGPDARKRLLAELDVGQRQDRAFAALALGISGASDFAPRLRKDFEAASDDSLKGALAVALGLMHDPEAFRPIAEVARTKANPELLRHLVWFFALDRGRGAAAVVEPIMIEGRVAELHHAAAVTLGLIGSLDSQQILIKHLGSTAPVTLRAGVAIGLARMGDRRGVAPLLKTLKNPNEQQIVRAAAAHALGILCQRSPWMPFARVTIDSNFDLDNEALLQIRELF
jgi:HEAT repeat protein